MEKLKSNEDIVDFDQLNQSKYDSLISCSMLMVFYPFCTGLGFAADLVIYKKLVKQGGK